MTARSASGLDGYPAVASLLVRRALSGSIRTDGNASAGVRVSLYRDDRPIAVAQTSADGTFVYADIDPGRYKVIVDSRSIHPAAWAEEVAPHPGGLQAARSDDASSLATAEHVTEAEVTDSPVDGLDFAFSFGAVTHAGDDGQGSLRQFIRNANAVPGPNAMRYFAGVATIHLASPLPRISESVTISGRALAGEIGSVTRVGMNMIVLRNPSVSELTIDFAGADVGIDAAADLTISDVILTGAKVHVRTAGRLTADNVVVGQLLDRRDAAGLEIAGDATLRRMLVTGMGRGGIIVRSGARVDAEHIEVSDCGDGVTVASPGSRIRHSLFLLNTNGVSLSDGNVVEASTFRGNRTAAVVPSGVFEPGDNELDANIVGSAATPGG